ncbi:MAG: GDP-mannose 4,6-dehydratase, partial [Synergistaceae bacterium]|nr:GDP-mannose 4,6-dehydratase [Synergistaceae bacterium]
MNTILVTGSPGFIGANLVIKLLQTLTSGLIVSLDNLNDYYDPELKLYRLKLIEKATATSQVHSPIQHVFVKGDISNKPFIEDLFKQYKFDTVVNLAAQAGVRYSITNPDAYIQ